MSTFALQCCPNCRRNVPPKALVCRACYTVLPRKKDEELTSATTPRRLIAGPSWIVAFVAIALVLWWARVDLGLVPPVGYQKGSSLNSGSSLFSSSGSPDAIPSPGGTASHWSVLQRNGSCILSQGVRNVGVAVATRAVFEVRFHDHEGNALGTPVNIQKRTAVGPGQEESVELVATCPRSTVDAQVALVDSSGPRRSEAKLELLANPVTAYRSVSSGNLSTIEVEVADLSICAPPDRCELKVSFGEDRNATYWFQRSRDKPEILVNDNSIFVGHLRAKKPATLHLEEELNGTTISLSYKHVHEQEPPSFLERLWDRILWRSGGEG